MYNTRTNTCTHNASHTHTHVHTYMYIHATYTHTHTLLQCTHTHKSVCISQSLLNQPGGLHIVAVGSVLIHCWDLLKEGKNTAL